MKKILSMILAIALSLTSCMSDDSIQNTEMKNEIIAKSAMDQSFTGVSVSSQGFLKFESVEAYEEVLNQLSGMSNEELNDWEESIGFISSYSYYEVENFENNIPYTEDINANPEITIEGFKNSSYVDPLLLRIIDRHGMIQIDHFVFNSRIDDGYVLEMNSSYLPTNYDDLKNGNFKSDRMNMLTNEWDLDVVGDIDIFDYLKTGVTGLTLMSAKSMFHKKDAPDMGPTHVIDNAGTTYRADAKVSYQKAVFFFSLIAKLKYQRKGTGNLSPWVAVTTQLCFLTNYDLNMVTSCKFKPKKHDEESPAPPHQNYPGLITDNKIDWRPYGGGRKLEKYELNAWFSYADLYTVNNVEIYAHIASGY
ncbi:DUF4848 domain-containing protein [Chryseobacterium gwangjuense]|uniref:DUF4848 domain-containing protein n=1 Tax=Chryseobacterium gwangjuense TaxID=1069980 RepID=UPI001E6253A0|nr:DUF4848 domain-containing protein [Chryseobacterium gwangjuense]MCE3074637.1 DUF4848 domain-containing protein [Chryseobacterium gwangjuense]